MIIKAETEPITPDEWLIRLVWHTSFTTRVPIISPGSFDPRKTETDGISFFRRACLDDSADALKVIEVAKRPRYGMVEISVKLLSMMGLTVTPDPVPTALGHVVVPEINITDFLADKGRFTPIKLRLATEASANIIRMPVAP